jgi:hypothetical protein
MAKNVYLRFPNGHVMRTQHPEYHRDAERLTNAEGERIYREQCRAELRKIVKPGAKVYCVLRSVSGSGMSRRISLFVVRPKTKDRPAELSNIDGLTATVTGFTLSDNGGIVANGCGMDMGFHLVYSLGRAIWPNGTPKAHGSRNGEPDRDGGYALKHEWL